MNFRIPPELNADLTVEKLDEHSWMISEGTGRGRTHCYLLEGNDKAALIDTGMGLIDMRKITESLTMREIFVINTHGHFDHITCNYQYPVSYLQPKDEQIFRESCRYERRISFWTDRLLKKGYSEKFIKSAEMRQIVEKLSRFPECTLPEAMCEGMIFDLGGRSLQIIETPGHTEGSVCIYEKENDRLYTGDTICEQGVLLNFEYSADAEVFKKSIEKLRRICNDRTRLYPGHQKVPLDTGWLDDYIECADAVLEKKKEMTGEKEGNIEDGKICRKRAVLYI